VEGSRTHCHVGLQWLETELLFSITVCVAVVILCVYCCITLRSAATLLFSGAYAVKKISPS